MKNLKMLTAAALLPLFALTACGSENEPAPATEPVTTAEAEVFTEAGEVSAEVGAEIGTEDAEETSEAAPTPEPTIEDVVEETSDAEEFTMPPPAPKAAPRPHVADGSREDPIALGDEIKVQDWTVVVNEVSVGTDEILAENQFNEPPAEGSEFVLISVDATYTGAESGTAWLDLDLTVLGTSGNTFDSYSCGVIPNDLDENGEQFAGSTVSGNICAELPDDQFDGALLIVEEWMSWDDERTFAALTESK